VHGVCGLESNVWSHVLTTLTAWVSSGNAQYFGAINDPLNNTAIEMHQYLDSDSSGTSGTCVSSTVGAERLQVATDWLKSKGLQGYLGEMGAGSNSQCITAIQGALCTMQTSGVWIGFAWWAAGPWWGNVRVLFSLVWLMVSNSVYCLTVLHIN